MSGASPTFAETAARLRRLVAGHLGIEPARVVPDAGFGSELGADSLDSVELSMLAEDEFGIALDDEEALAAFDTGKTFGDALALIDAKRPVSAANSEVPA